MIDAVEYADLPENSDVLETLLIRIYSHTQQNPTTPLDILLSTLRAAHKYGMEEIVRRIGRELVVPMVVKGRIKESYASTYPLEVYAVARDLALEDAARIAALASLRQPSLATHKGLTPSNRLQLGRMRHEREHWFKASRWWSIMLVQGGDSSACACAWTGRRARDVPVELKETIMRAPCAATVQHLVLEKHFGCHRCHGAACVHFSKMLAAYKSRFGED